MREYSLKIAETVRQYLDNDDWNYEFNEENGFFLFALSLKCKFQHANVLIRINTDSFMILFTLPICADEEVRTKVMEFIIRANHDMIRGCFEMDLSDGEIRFRTAHYCGEYADMINEQIVKDTLALNYSMVERYGSEMLAVMMGFMEPEEAVNQADSKDMN